MRYTVVVTNPFVQSYARNFDDALRLLEAALSDCPEELWETDLWPDEASIAAVRDRASALGERGLAVIGTIDGHRQPEQLQLVEAVAATGVATIAVAMRGPWDVAGYPASATAIATYGILPPILEALAAALAGEAPMPGRLPVAVGSAPANAPVRAS